MKHIAYGKVVLFAQLDDFFQNLRQLGTRHSPITTCVTRPHLANGTKGSLAPSPEHGPLCLVLCQLHIPDVVLPAYFYNFLRVLIHALGHTVELDEKNAFGIQRISHFDGLFHGPHNRIVQHLQGGRDDPFRNDGRNSVGPVLDGFVYCQHCLDCLGGPFQLKDHLGHKAKGSLAPHQ